MSSSSSITTSTSSSSGSAVSATTTTTNPVAVATIKKNPYWLAGQPFVFGAIAASFSTFCVQPIDMVKVRLQLSGEGGGATIKNPFVMTASIVRNEGPTALYKGLSAAIFRQCTYGTVRLGLFRTISDKFKEPGKPVPASISALAGMAAGIGGSMVGTPSDVALVRMQADATLPVEQRRNYTNVFSALGRIVKEEGWRALWKGNMPNIYRNVAMSVGMLATYDQTKYALAPYVPQGFWHNFASSTCAGGMASVLALPFDFVKTRLQKQQPMADGRLPYSGFFDCGLKSIRSEGFWSLYKGFWVFCLRVGPHAMITLLTLEELNNFSKKMKWS